MGKRGIARRGRKVRHIWDLRWHGENRGIADPTHDDALHRCGLCGQPHCGLAHIICASPYLSHARDSARSDLWYFATRQSPAPAARLMQRYVQLLFGHPDMDQRGQLWLGHWPPPLRRALSPLPQRLPLREGQATLGRIGRRATEVFRDLWDTYAEALALAQPPPLPGHTPTRVDPQSSSVGPLPPYGSAPLGRSASCRQRLALHTPPLCPGGHIIRMPVLASPHSKGSYR